MSIRIRENRSVILWACLYAGVSVNRIVSCQIEAVSSRCRQVVSLPSQRRASFREGGSCYAIRLSSQVKVIIDHV